MKGFYIVEKIGKTSTTAHIHDFIRDENGKIKEYLVAEVAVTSAVLANEEKGFLYCFKFVWSH